MANRPWDGCNFLFLKKKKKKKKQKIKHEGSSNVWPQKQDMKIGRRKYLSGIFFFYFERHSTCGSRIVICVALLKFGVPYLNLICISRSSVVDVGNRIKL